MTSFRRFPVAQPHKNSEIQTIYMVEEVAFEDLDEAKEHLKKIKLSKLIEPAIGGVLLDVLLDILVQKKTEIVKILEA
jgi:hypothetical protein